MNIHTLLAVPLSSLMAGLSSTAWIRFPRPQRSRCQSLAS